MFFLHFYATFLTESVYSLFTSRNDHAMLTFEIIVKRESAYFTRVADYMPE